MEVLGRDPVTECYRVKLEVADHHVTAMVPERLAASRARLIPARPTHQAAYVWIAENERNIKAAVTHLVRGDGSPKAPFDQITLAVEEC